LLEQVREACGIRKAVIPAHLYDDQVYDKWGNPTRGPHARPHDGQVARWNARRDHVTPARRLAAWTDAVRNLSTNFNERPEARAMVSSSDTGKMRRSGGAGPWRRDITRTPPGASRDATRGIAL
jgi:hypothetical protein